MLQLDRSSCPLSEVSSYLVLASFEGVWRAVDLELAADYLTDWGTAVDRDSIAVAVAVLALVVAASVGVLPVLVLDAVAAVAELAVEHAAAFVAAGDDEQLAELHVEPPWHADVVAEGSYLAVSGRSVASAVASSAVAAGTTVLEDLGFAASVASSEGCCMLDVLVGIVAYLDLPSDLADPS